MIQAQLGGSVAAGFEPVREAFAANFEKHGEVGAACCVHLHGKRVVDLWGGVTAPGGSEPYTADTLQMVWSTTKGGVAMAAHMLAQDGKLDFHAPYARGGESPRRSRPPRPRLARRPLPGPRVSRTRSPSRTSHGRTRRSRPRRSTNRPFAELKYRPATASGPPGPSRGFTRPA